ncbi:MAG: SPOR domain-containing protein [Pseudoxanthomonas suwonensis]|nr:SPOR domain-containing protein [Pseudoxanthomonas suwonensis]
MAARRGKSQARRRGANNHQGLPGWAWMVLGIVLTIAAVFLAPRFLGKDDGDGFFRPRPNPDAQPAAITGTDPDVEAAPEPRPARSGDRASDATAEDEADADGQSTEFDFYTLLPGQEVAMTDAQLAAAAREERARQERERRQQQAAAEASRPQPLDETTQPAAPATPARSATPPTTAATSAASTTATSSPAPAAASTPAPTTPAPAPASRSDTPYILQAGAFQASGDAEALKARIALLGLNARVESAQISGKTVYRVRMGPYATASELSNAKDKLSSGGLPAMAIQAR